MRSPRGGTTFTPSFPEDSDPADMDQHPCPPVGAFLLMPPSVFFAPLKNLMQQPFDALL